MVSITIRMSSVVLVTLKHEATRRGVRDYKPLMKQWLSERIVAEQLISVTQLGIASGQVPLTADVLHVAPSGATLRGV
jgi:hypothetical protein